MSKNLFVFVVCGGLEHIDTLHFSLKALKKFSNNEIIVVTDSSRNEIPVNHETIIDFKTPSVYSHHQASIFLKISLHKLLPAKNNYCYLDSDVIAVSSEVDSVFNFFTEPITFSQDYSSIDEFSPFAVNCNCLEKFQVLNREYQKASELYEQTLMEEYQKVLEEITQATEENRSNMFKQLASLFRYYSGSEFYVLNDKYKLNKKTKQWLSSDGKLIEEKYSRNKFITDKTGFVWNEKGNTFLTKDGLLVTQLMCKHLRQQVKKTFNIEIPVNSWKHWNGGVFLFNEKSHSFMDFWYEATLKIFDNTEWKTRDQGTLAATTCNFGLQNQETLDINFNFIVDYHNKELKYEGNCTFQSHEKIHKPFFLHIFHHFGDKNWVVWQDVEKLLATAKKKET